MKINSGQKLLKKAKKIIPGGNQLLSKRSEMFLPDLWPNYYKKARGCRIWDLDGNAYIDFSGMGVTSCILGYANEKVDKAVKYAISNGSMSTLNCTEEYDLAEKLISIHPWSRMAKFTRSGGEACSVAIRIARAYSKNDRVAICGYHGWHDWYLSLNLDNKKNLDSQLLPGLDPMGVPKNLKDSTVPFYFNDVKSVNALKKYDDLGVIILEPMRDVKPDKEFLDSIENIKIKTNAVLIVDEITSGFHDNYGGLHLKHNIKPDIAIFGKALGNGYPISAIIGRKNVMDICQDTFISSTMWTERTGFAAALATLESMEENNVQKINVKNGKYYKKKIMNECKKINFNIEISGCDSMPGIKFNYPESNKMQTYFTQEMLRLGYLAGSKIVFSLAHNKTIIDKYIKDSISVFKKILQYIESNKSLPLLGPEKHKTFKRLTGKKNG